MKKIFYSLLGLLLLLPGTKVFGISLNDLEDEVYRPENLPGGRLGDTSVETKIAEGINSIVEIILFAAGGIAVFMLIVAGIVSIGSFGKPEAKERAVKIAKWAIIGLFAIILAYATVTNVIDLIYRATT